MFCNLQAKFVFANEVMYCNAKESGGDGKELKSQMQSTLDLLLYKIIMYTNTYSLHAFKAFDGKAPEEQFLHWVQNDLSSIPPPITWGKNDPVANLKSHSSEKEAKITHCIKSWFVLAIVHWINVNGLIQNP